MYLFSRVQLLSGYGSLTEQLLHDLSSFNRAVLLGQGIKFLGHPGGGTEECVARYLGRRSFRCLVDEHDVFSWRPFCLDQFAVFSIIPIIDPCLRHVDSLKNNQLEIGQRLLIFIIAILSAWHDQVEKFIGLFRIESSESPDGIQSG